MNEENVKSEECCKDVEQKCHDCGVLINVNGEEITNGVFLKYKDGEKDVCIYKCNECYEKSPSLANFSDCEVYSRVVGYYRPVQQWNEGKTQEYSEREEFKCGKEYLE
jgi:anaerobic ribonucleoside-triphosphate reductase